MQNKWVFATMSFTVGRHSCIYKPWCGCFEVWCF